MHVNVWLRLWTQRGTPPTCYSCGFTIMPGEAFISTEGRNHRVYRHADCYEKLWITLPAK